MKVILLSHIKNLGQKGDVKEVSEGYFRNFLQPQKLAIPADQKQVQHINAQKEKQIERLENIRESAMAIKNRLENQTIILEEKVTESGTLYASISAKEISKAIEAQLKVQIPEKEIALDSHIKKIGEYVLSIKLYKDVTISLILHVKAK